MLPSYREGFPRSLIEASAMARPIIATNTAGCKDVLEEGETKTGFFCNVKDSYDLADKMIKMIELPLEERIKMGDNGRKKALKEFDSKIINEKYLKVIDDLMR